MRRVASLLLAFLFLGALFFRIGVSVGLQVGRLNRSSLKGLTSTELSWIIYAREEQISKWTDDIKYARLLQQELLSPGE